MLVGGGRTRVIVLGLGEVAGILNTNVQDKNKS